jgi:hypothetical protein
VIIANPADLAGRATPSRLVPLVLAAALAAALGAVLVYTRAGLVLAHYDAKAHLVVARRVVDNITPGWQQIGAVWLPLPHLLNVLPLQIDAIYRTGAFAIFLSVTAFAIGTAALARLIARATGCRGAAVAGAALLALNPNVLYLQATPMTEPILIGLTLAGIAALYGWVDDGANGMPHAAGLALAGACLTRYEAWPVTGAAVALTLLALWRQGQDVARAAVGAATVAVWPLAAVSSFFLLSWGTVGEWFVTGGFFVPDFIVQGRLVPSLLWVVGGINDLAGTIPVGAAVLAGAWTIVSAIGVQRRAACLVLLAPAAALALPWFAFFDGHPFRVRYMVPLVPAVALLVGLGIGLLPSLRGFWAAALVAAALWQVPPFDWQAPMLAEARWDEPHAQGRRRITACLDAQYRGEKILASMGSLAHYMHEAAEAGIYIHDFIHEGNGDIWIDALYAPRRHAGWVLIEEQAEGGDLLAGASRQRPEFLAGFDRVCEGGGVALYRRRQLVIR